ncbi:MAG: glycerophosphodiester phosphodiesterase [Candidatus Promineifilaceae bacterium]
MIKNFWLSAEKTLIIGHRGASDFAPENTMMAFELSQQQGSDGLEFDIHLSRDGVPMVIHDHTLDRTTNATGPVGALDCAALGQVDAGQGEPVPTLAQVFDRFGRTQLYNVEIKEYGARSAECVAAVAALIEQYGLAAYCTISSFEYEVVQQSQAMMPTNTAFALLRMPDSSPIPDWYAGHADHPHYPMIDAAYMAWAADAKQRVHTWTVNEADEARRLYALGVNALITNKPAFLRAAVYES